jgi:hypothetical protein
MLEYRNADCRVDQIHEHDVTSCLTKDLKCDVFLVLSKQRFRECGKANAYSANIEFNVSAHGEHIKREH